MKTGQLVPHWLVVPALTVAACGSGRSNPPPVAQAIGERDLGRLEELLEEGADPDDSSYLDRPMWVAVDLEDARFAELLLEHGADVHHSRDSNWTYLHEAARRGSARTVEALVDAGIDPCDRVDQAAPPRAQDSSLPDASGMTALDVARAVGNEDAVPVLEDASAC